jgi:hypothetical protein
VSLGSSHPHLQSYVDRAWLTFAQAGAMIAYSGDVESVRAAESRGERRRPGQQERAGFSIGSDKARSRAKAAEGAMGDQPRAVVHHLAYLGKSLFEAAKDLHMEVDEAKVLMRAGAKSLLRIYSEFKETA